MNQEWFESLGKTKISQSGGKTLHIFAVTEPDGKTFPLRTGFPYIELPHEGDLSEKLKAWEFITRHGLDPEKYRYHGRWKRNFDVKDDHYYKYEFIEFDDEVKRVFKTKETGSKFGL